MVEVVTTHAMDGTRSLITNGELILYGVIDPAGFFADSIRAIDVIDSLAALPSGGELLVRINSPGGSLDEGVAIYNSLRTANKRIIVRIDAMCASAASVIAMAGDEIVMAAGSTMMIHDPYASLLAAGSEELRAAADVIDQQREQMIGIYAARTGASREEISAWMASETYMDANTALERGFCDRVEEPAMKVAACATLNKADLARLMAAPSTVQTKGLVKAAPPPPHRTRITMTTNTGGTPTETPAAVPPIITPPAAPFQPITGTPPAPAPLPVYAAAPPAPAPVAPPAPIDLVAIRREAVMMDRQRALTIRAEVRRARLPDELADQLVESGATVELAREKIIDAWATMHESSPENGNGFPRVPGNSTVTVDAAEKWAQGAALGLLARTGLKGGERNEFSGLTMYELARSALNMRGIKNGHMDRMTLVGTAFTTMNAVSYHTTSDFGNVLGTTAYRAMMTGWEEVDETFPLWTGKGQASDFRPISRVDMGLFPNLDKVEEGAEYTYGTISDTGVQVQIATYGRMFSITRQAIINDDLGFFDRVPRKMGRAAKRTIGNLVYAILNGNPTMQDGLALFHGTHGNLASPGTIISVTSIGAARAAMARQADPDNITTSIGVIPKWLIVPPELLTLANTTMSSERIPGDPGQIANPVRGVATPIADGRLSGTAWYMAADPNQADTIEVTYLDGVETPFMDQRQGWSVDGTEFKVRIDAGVKALHWRGLYKNPGAASMMLSASELRALGVEVAPDPRDPRK